MIQDTNEQIKGSVPVFDVDIHPNPKKKRDLFPYMTEYWRDYFIASRFRGHLPIADFTMPVNAGVRADSIPEGGIAGSSYDMFNEQVMEPFNYEYAVIFPDGTFQLSGAPQREMAVALATAYNEWQIDHWLSKDKRILGSIIVAAQDPVAAAKEIDRVAKKNPQMVQVGLGIHAPTGGWGDPFYYPIWEAAIRNNLVVTFHVSAGGVGRYPGSPIGTANYFVEFQSTHSLTYQAQMANIIFSGLFEKYPDLRFAFIEGGFAWVAPLMYMMDTQWRAIRIETPWVKRAPSDYVRKNMWFGTQPMIDPEKEDHKFLIPLIEMVGEDRLLFASDYPHWEFDSPTAALKLLPKQMREKILYYNAKKLYGL